MNFSEKLNGLMILTGISQSKLSKELSVDASLISRWRKGERNPINNQELILAIAHAFAQRIRMNYQVEALSVMLGHKIDADTTTDALKEEILFWLNTDNSIFVDFITRVNHAKKTKGDLIPSTDTNNNAAGWVKKRTASFTLGQIGAVQEFVEACLSSTPGMTLMLYCDETKTWMRYAVDYIRQVFAHHPKLGDSFGEIQMIVPSDVYAGDVSVYFDFIAPFAKSASFRIFRHKNYEKCDFRHSLAIVEGVVLLSSFGIGRDDESATFALTNQAVIQQHTLRFREMTMRCETLVTLRDRSDTIAMVTEVKQFIQHPADSIYEGNAMPLVMLPEKMIDELVYSVYTQHEKAYIIEYIYEFKSLFKEYLRSSRYTLYIPLYTPQEVKEGAVYMSWVPQFSGGKPVFGPIRYLAMLKRLYEVLEAEPHISLQIVDRNLHDYCYYVKSGYSVYAVYGTPNTLVYHSALPRVAEQMYQAIIMRYQSIPGQSRSANQRKLRQHIELFENHIG